MNLDVLVFPTLVLVSLTALLLLLSVDWRLSIAALAFQYVGVFLLVALSWPLEIAVVKVVAGWMVGAVLGIALVGVPVIGQVERETPFPFFLFRVLGAVLVGLIVYSLADQITQWIPVISLAQVDGGLILIGLGMLHLGLTDQPLGVILGLLTVISGFEIFYAAVEPSTLVTGLLASVNLGLALLGAYLLTNRGEEEAS